jgi:alkylation response protein AidB-like acyl-CoA dehydrogenase
LYITEAFQVFFPGSTVQLTFDADVEAFRASLRTRAVRDGDDFVVNGQKVWTSGAHDADVLLTFVRTDPNATKHKGISALRIRTDLPGVVYRPFASACDQDDLDFNEVFFNDVRVPTENLVGPLNEGWRVASGWLGHERNMLWLSYADRLQELVEDFRPQTLCDRDRYATLVMDNQALRLLGSVALVRAAHGDEDVAALTVLKLFGSEASQTATEYALSAAGVDGFAHPTVSGPYSAFHLDLYRAGWLERYVRSFGGTIAGGISEIERNIIAQRVLGLPRN